MESEHTKQGLSIGVHAAQEVVYAEVVHDDGEEGQHHHQVVSAGTLKGGKRLGVQGNGIDEEGDEGPCLLWIPSPVVALAHVGPDGADEDAHAEDGFLLIAGAAVVQPVLSTRVEQLQSAAPQRCRTAP